MYNLVARYEYQGKQYDVFIRRNARNRKIIYHFRKGAFYITSPFFTSNKYIIDGLKKHASFLIERDSQKKKYYDGKGIYVFGEYQELKDGFVTVCGKTFLFLSLDNFYEKVKDIALPIFKMRTELYEQAMNISPYYDVKLRKKNTNYGVNSRRTHTITYNTFLVHFSLEIIDSVIVHELAHHYYFDHSPKFYNVVYNYYPNYKEVHHKLTKEIFKW